MTAPDLLPELALRLRCEVAALRAVIEVESTGSGIEADRPVIRLEVHHCLRRLNRFTAGRLRVDGPKAWQGHRFFDDDGRWYSLHRDQAREWRAFDYACTIDRVVAIESTSWGLGQVLGVSWQRLDYASPDEFVTAQDTEAGQLDTMARFIRADFHLRLALQSRDWATFARRYNGAGNVTEYSTRLETAYALHRGEEP